MNEEGTTTAPEAPEGEQLETTTQDEVLSIMGKTAPETVETEEEQPEGEESPETPEAVEETPEEAVETPETVETEESQNNVDEATPTEIPTFTLEVEDANGNKFTVSPDDNLEDVLAEFEPKNNGQVLQLMRDLDKLSNDKASYEARREQDTAEAARAEQISSIHDGWDKEVLKLQGEKRLPLDAKIEDRKQAVFKFMGEENDKRATDGRPMLQSFEDALDKLELKEGKAAQEEAAKNEREANKKRGGLVGGSSAPATSGSPAYKSGSARNANEALHEMGLL
jgi:hypothetical protein